MTIQIWTLWLILAGFFFILEIATEGFLVCWFGVGALCAMGISFLFPESYLLQVAIMAVISIILVLSTRKLFKKFSAKDNLQTNVYTILGKKALVSQTIDNLKGQGQIKIDGDVWSARNETDDIISEGEAVEIVRIDGVKAIVKKSN